MVTTPSPASPIDKLPAELLEKILLEVVASSPPPILDADAAGSGAEFPRHYEIRANIVYRYEVVDSTSATLAFRATSRRFRDLSWRALAKVVGETIFDLASKQSIENLAAISSSPHLAPWVSKLSI